MCVYLLKGHIAQFHSYLAVDTTTFTYIYIYIYWRGGGGGREEFRAFRWGGVGGRGRRDRHFRFPHIEFSVGTDFR